MQRHLSTQKKGLSKEHLAMKAGEKQWRKDREDMALYKKRMRVLDRHHGEGVVEEQSRRE